MKKQPEVTEATRKNFEEVFCAFYRSRPIEKITVKEITERAGYNRATFYEYFRDVYDLRDQLEGRLIQQLQKSIEKNVQMGLGHDNFVSIFTNLLHTQKELVQTFLGNTHNTHLVQRLTAEALPHVMELFGISPENTRARYTLAFYLPGVVSLVGVWLREREIISVEDLGDLLRSILEDGILAQLQMP